MTETPVIIPTRCFDGEYIHPSTPSGFARANDLQVQSFVETGSVHGASKVAWVADGHYSDSTPRDPVLVIRMRPPRTLEDILSSLGARGMVSAEQYRAEYEKGWRHARRSSEYPSGSWAMEDGFLDATSGRSKWHLTYCSDHDACGEA